MLRFHEGSLGGDGLRIVIADELAGRGIPQIRRLRLRIPVAYEAVPVDEIGLQLRPRMFAAVMTVGLVKPVVVGLYVIEFAAVESRADKQLSA